MNRRLLGTVAGTTALATSVAFGSTAAADATPVTAAGTIKSADAARGDAARSDNLPSPMGEQATKLRREAVNQVVKGNAKFKTINGKRVIEVAAPGQDKGNGKGKGKGRDKNKGKGRYVQYDVNRQASIFSILVEFGNQTKPVQGGTPGPLHGQIAEPNRATDNSTYWEPKFDRKHYQDMMFGKGESFKDFYAKQSQGRFDVEGDVSDWVKVPYNEARYGHNPVAGDGTSQSEGYWALVQDGVNAWYNAQKAAGKTDAEIKTYLAQFDKWDRYDYDGDGNFDEPDGYIDHIQIIHAGEGEEAGGGAEGEDAVWSHRWAVYNGYGTTGPNSAKQGGARIGNTDFWVGDYTTEPENGGLGVFTHEFGHDLGLPDFYDTTNRATNSTSFWTLMSSGSWLNHGKDSIGTTPGYMGAEEKLFLGWNDVQSVPYGKAAKVNLGPADLDDKNAPQTIAVSLPDKSITTDYNKPASGSSEWWSGSADDLDVTLTRDIDLKSARTATLAAKLAYDTEEDYDYFWAEVSTDGGSNWTQVGPDYSGTAMNWNDASWNLSPYVGKAIKFRFHYQTDGGVHGKGVFLDDLALTVDGATTVDNVESGNGAWTPKGFSRISGSVTEQVAHYYLAEYRRYNGYDATLKTGPYNFGFLDSKPDWVEHFPYQDGLLVWYVDNQYEDNNVSTHPGHGSALPVDAHPEVMRWNVDGTLMSNRITPYDATFGTESTDAFTLHKLSSPTPVPRRAAVTTFDDSNAAAYYNTASPYASTLVAGSGTRIKVISQNKNQMKVDVSFTKKK